MTDCPHPAWHLSDVLAATGGRVLRLDGPRDYVGISTDTRKLRPGEIFVALRGPNHDGRAFVAEAIRRGATAAIVDRDGASSEHGTSGAAASLVEVADSLRALGDLAAYHRRRLRLTVAAVTGSNGKTTTKELLASIMAGAVGSQAVLRTSGTENNLIGVPLTLLRASANQRIAALELGMNAPGEIWRLAEIADPDVGVVTCVAPAHIEGLGSIAGVARAKGELYRRLRSDAVAVANADDQRVREIATPFPGRTVWFGAGGAVAADTIRCLGTEGVRFTLVVDGERRDVRMPLPGIHNITNALAAAAVAHVLGATLDAIAAGLCTRPQLPMRMQVVTLPGPLTVINDAYNANPASMRSSLAVLAASGGGAKIAVLGEMRELGEASETFHREVGRAAAEEHVAVLIAVGAGAEAMRDGALAAGMDPNAVFAAASRMEAATRVRQMVRPGDSILIKGSRAARMEDVLHHLREAATDTEPSS